MSTLALAHADGNIVSGDELASPIKDKIRRAKQWRRQFEPTWHLSMALAAGRHWQTYDLTTRTLRRVQDIDPRYAGRELYEADVVTEYRTTALGELGSDNDRPELLLRRDDVVSEAYQEQLNRAVAYGWDQEWDGDDVTAQVDRYVVDLGTAAIRCHFDATVGQVMADNVPYLNGKPVLDMDQATQLLGQGPNPDVTMGAIRQGKICWTPLSAFNILVPPGVVHEKLFPWECTVVPTLLSDVKDTYGALAATLREDNDIGSVLGTDTSLGSPDPQRWSAGDGRNSRLRDHVWLYTYFERASSRYQQGRVMVFGSNEMTLLDVQERLPYQAPDGTHRSGIAYFHWWRVTGRFWSRGLVEAMLSGQRLLDKRRTQANEIIDKNMPYVIVQKDSLAKRRRGLVNELVEVDPSEKAPQPVTGIGPGPWMQGDVEAIREDITHATGLNGPRRGENPPSVDTYSALALLNEADTGKREQIYLERRRGIKQLVEDSVYDIRAYWGPQKQLALAGDDEMLDAVLFDATKIPPFFIVESAKGSAKPRSQAAELQKITDIWNAAVISQAVMQSPAAWIQWYKASIDAGEALDLPSSEVEDPGEKAELENHYLQQGVPMPIAYYDIHAVHLPRHRRAQDMAMFAQDMQTWQIIEDHCQLHINAATAQAEAQMQMQAALPAPAGPAAAGGAPGPGMASPPKPPGMPSPPSRTP